MKVDYGADLPEGEVERALGQGRCPRCGSNVTDMRSTSASQFTLDERGVCYRNGEAYMGFRCNKERRDGLAAR